METLKQIYRHSLSLLTDPYEDSDLNYLATPRGNDDQPLFEDDFLRDLGEPHFTCDVDAAPEGSVVFPHEPIVRVKGPLWLAQVVEAPLLNIINFQTLIATKAARVCFAACDEPILEFGLRRAQGIDGALAAIRSAGGEWTHKVKLSEQACKTSIPGVLNVRRYLRDDQYLRDLIFDETTGVPEAPVLVDPGSHLRRRPVERGTPYSDLLLPMMRDGVSVSPAEPIERVRERAEAGVSALHPGIRRFLNPHEYPVGLERRLHDRRSELILETREVKL